MCPAPEGSPPPEVPEEFQDAYRRAYQEALRAGGPDPDDVEHTQAVSLDDLEREDDAPRHSTADEFVPPAPVVVPAGGSHRSGARPAAPAPVPAAPKPAAQRTSRPAAGQQAVATVQEWRRHGWFVPLVLALLAATLILIAYLVGRMFSSGVAGDEVPGGSAAATPTATAAARSQKPTPAAGKPWQGPVDVVGPTGVKASCTAPPGVDAGGHKVGYEPANTYDADPTTAWRCNGAAVGQQITFALPAGVKVGQLGLIPGYAKTDPRSHVDRYAENNRITKVRWIFADGTSVDQTMSADPKDRSLRVKRVPPVASDSVTLQILEVSTGKRNTTAISEVQIGAVG